MRAPAEAAGPFRLVAMIDQESQHPVALESRQFIDLRGEVGVDVNNLLAGDGIRAQNLLCCTTQALICIPSAIRRW
jgi:hypothetical protein